MTKEQVINGFWYMVKFNRKLLRQKNKKDACGMHTSEIRNAFCDYIEGLRKTRSIPDELANNISL